METNLFTFTFTFTAATELQVTAGGEGNNKHRWFVLAVVGLGTLLSAMAGSAITLALPSIGQDLRISIDAAGWVIEAYLLIATVLLLLVGRAGDILGHRTIYLGGFLVFGAASLACGLSNSFILLIVSRLAQGIGGAMIMATGPALLTTTFQPEERGRALGMLATATYTGLTVGPPLGGFLISAFGWRWIFFLNVITGAIIYVLGTIFLPRGQRRQHVSLDIAGALTLVLGLPLLLLAIVQAPTWGWMSPLTLASTCGGLALLVAFLKIELRGAEPLIQLSLFRSRRFTGATISAVANYIALFIAIILLPFFLLEGLGISADKSGLILSVQSLVMVLVASPSGWLSDRIGCRGLSTAGLVLLGAGLAALSRVGEDSEISTVAACLAIMGCGTGIFISPNSSALLGSAPREQQGIAGGVLAVARSLGMIVGVAAAVSLFRAAGGRTGSSWQENDFQAMRFSFVFASGVCLIGALASALQGRRSMSS